MNQFTETYRRPSQGGLRVVSSGSARRARQNSRFQSLDSFLSDAALRGQAVDPAVIAALHAERDTARPGQTPGTNWYFPPCTAAGTTDADTDADLASAMAPIIAPVIETEPAPAAASAAEPESQDQPPATDLVVTRDDILPVPYMRRAARVSPWALAAAAVVVNPAMMGSMAVMVLGVLLMLCLLVGPEFVVNRIGFA